MKRSHVLALAATLVVSAAFAGTASASSSNLATHVAGPRISLLAGGGDGGDGGILPGGATAHGNIGSALPSANAALHLRALGGGDGGGSDDGGALPGGGIAHGNIGSAPPSANAVLHLRALRGNDGSSDA
jgi:hypothetical protein